ncbi:MAG: tRNA 4-thiouridine(8) synthase ThiI [Firmicutes bacterium]|nr:tRNA 4-thiouridine(8) synthase ThiI [Bacillota bacterium]
MFLIRYQEIGIKGRNRYLFENKINSNIKKALYPLGKGKIKITNMRGRILVALGDAEPSKAAEYLSRVFGIATFSPVIKIVAEEEAIYQSSEAVMRQALERKGIKLGENDNVLTFRTNVKRADKTFPIRSMDMAARLGSYLLDNIPGLKVDLHNPDLSVSVDIRDGNAYVFSEKLPGPGGLPLGTSGKGILLLSGGIDSPVAGWMCMKRGVEIEALHFHSFPFTGEKSKEKVKDLCRVLARHNNRIKLHIAHFTDIQKSIQKSSCPEDFRITVMRRFMFRIAERLAAKNNALALVTGESVGQVSSQTLENMTAINEVTKLPVLRPVVAFDKNEIVEMAQKIETYDISIQPYEDCCTLFLPKVPITTKPSLDKIHKAEESLDIDEMVNDAMEKIETIYITSNS